MKNFSPLRGLSDALLYRRRRKIERAGEARGDRSSSSSSSCRAHRHRRSAQANTRASQASPQAVRALGRSTDVRRPVGGRPRPGVLHARVLQLARRAHSAGGGRSLRRGPAGGGEALCAYPHRHHCVIRAHRDCRAQGHLGAREGVRDHRAASGWHAARLTSPWRSGSRRPCRTSSRSLTGFDTVRWFAHLP